MATVTLTQYNNLVARLSSQHTFLFPRTWQQKLELAVNRP